MSISITRGLHPVWSRQRLLTNCSLDLVQVRSCIGWISARFDPTCILKVTQPTRQEALHNSPQVVRFVFGWKSWCFLVISREKVLKMLEILSLPRGSFEILGFFVVFRVLHSLLTNYGPIPSSLSTASPRNIWMYRNITVSFVHSVFSAFLSLYWWVLMQHLFVWCYFHETS